MERDRQERWRGSRFVVVAVEFCSGGKEEGFVRSPSRSRSGFLFNPFSSVYIASQKKEKKEKGARGVFFFLGGVGAARRG